MVKECLRHGIVPFIVDDKHRGDYNKGIQSWRSSPSVLRNACLKAQERFKRQLDLQRLLQRHKGLWIRILGDVICCRTDELLLISRYFFSQSIWINYVALSCFLKYREAPPNGSIRSLPATLNSQCRIKNWTNKVTGQPVEGLPCTYYESIKLISASRPFCGKVSREVASKRNSAGLCTTQFKGSTLSW